MNNVVKFNFFGNKISIESHEGNEFLLRRIREQFLFFGKGNLNGENRVSIVIYSDGLNRIENPFLLPIIWTKKWKAYGFWKHRIVEYKSGSQVQIKIQRTIKEYLISAKSNDEALEIAYQCIHSCVGELLDDAKMHRVHGLSFQINGVGYLAPLNSRRGKSSLAYQLQNEIAGPVLGSDECPVFQNNLMLAFPNRLTLSKENCQILGVDTSELELFPRKDYLGKFEIPVSLDKVIFSLQPNVLLIDGGNAALPRFERGSKFRAFNRLFINMVIGYGLTQMAEYILRGDNLLQLLKAGISRLISAIRLTLNCECWVYYQTLDPVSNFKGLTEFAKAKNKTN